MKSILDYYKNTEADLEILDPNTPENSNYRNIEGGYHTRDYILNNLKLNISKYTDKIGITCTLKKKFHLEDATWMHRHIERSIIRSRLWRKRKYILIPEFTQNGNLHYHGIIYDCYHVHSMKIVNWWRRTYGFVKVEMKLRNYKNWVRYITKDLGKTGLWIIYKF